MTRFLLLLVALCCTSYSLHAQVSVPYTQDFESGLSSDFTIKTDVQSDTALDVGSNCAGNNSLLFTGNAATGFTGGSTSATPTNAWVDNTTHHSQADLMVDATGVSNSLVLNFDLKQEYSYGPRYSWFRILVDGVQVGPDFNPTTTNSDPCATQTVNLTAFIGTTFTLSFQASMKYNDVSGNGGQGDNAFLDNISIEEVTCLAPSGIAAANIMSTSADISWTAGNASQDDWEVSVVPMGNPAMGGTSSGSLAAYTATGLTANTNYDVYVREICSAGDTTTWVGPFTFTTSCPALFTPAYVEDFTTFVPTCWEEAGDGNPITGPSDLNNNSLWNHTDYLNAGTINDAAKINLYTNNRRDWLLSPTFDLSSGTWELVVDAGLTNFGSTAADAMGSDDTVQVLVTTNNGVTWTPLYTWDVNNQPPTAGQAYIIDLSAYTGASNRFAIWASDGTVNDIEDYDFHIGDFEIRTPPTCAEPTMLTATAITAINANLGWTQAGGTMLWDIEWGTAGFSQGAGTMVTGIASNPYTLAGLAGNTTYSYYVRADCGGAGVSTWAGPFSFTTPCATFMAPYNEDFENTGAIPSCWSQGTSNSENWLFANTASGKHVGNNGTAGGMTSSGGYFAWIDDSTPDNTGTTLESPLVDVSGLTSPQLSFYLISNNEGNSNVDFSVDVWDGTAWNTGFYTSNSNTLNGEWEKIIVDLSTLTITGPVQLRFIADEPSNGDFYDDVAIDDVEIKEAPTCFEPTMLMASNVTAVSADLDWTQSGTPAGGWEIEYGPAPLVPGTGTRVTTASKPYNLTGLSDLTSYDFYVRAVCGSGDSSTWAGPIMFRTLIAPLVCATGNSSVIYTEDFEGAFPTGWNQVATGDPDWTWDGFTGTSSASTGPSAAHSGSGFMYLEATGGTSGDADTLTAPSIDLTTISSAARLLFHYHMYGGAMGTMSVEVSDDAGASWNLGWTITGQQHTIDTDPWSIASVDLTPYIGSTILVRFIGSKGAGTPVHAGDMAIDLVEVEACVSCAAPTNLMVSNITAESADLDWAQNGTPAGGWEIEYGPAPLTLGTGITVAAATKPYTLTGLSDLTDYDFYVRAVCGSGDSSIWAGPMMFSTPIVPLNCTLSTASIIFKEDFEGALPTGWSQVATADPDWTWDGITGTTSASTGPSAAHSGSGFVYLEATGGTSGDADTLTSPSIDISARNSGSGDARLLFYYHMYGAAMGTLSVEISENGGASWNPAWTITGQQHTMDTDPWSIASIDLGPYSSNAILVRFIGTKGAGTPVHAGDMAIDLVQVEACVSCPAPTNLAVSGVTATSADLDWTENGSAADWVIEYGPAPLVAGTGTMVAVSSKPHNLTGLTAATDYDFFVRSDCGGGDSSAWVGPINFTTLCPAVLAGDSATNAITIPSLPYNDMKNTAICYTNTTNNASADVWYQYIVEPCTDSLIISLCGSGFDTYVRVFASDTATQLYFNDDNSVTCGSGGNSHLAIDVTNSTTLNSGDTVFILVEGFTTNTGMYDLNVSSTFKCPGDVQVTEGFTMMNDYCGADSIDVAIVLTNNTASPEMNVPFTGSINGMTLSGTYPVLGPNATDTVVVRIPTPITAAYNLMAWTELAGDLDMSNDTAAMITVYVSHLAGSAMVTSSYNGADISCNGLSDAEVTASVATAGLGNIDYMWLGNSTTTAIATGLSAGMATVVLTDSIGCMDTAMVMVTEPMVITATLDTAINVTCNGAANGQIQMTVTGGTAPNTYIWSNGATTEDLTGLGVIICTGTITDANSCMQVTSTVTITEPSSAVSATATDDGTGSSATAAGAGGTVAGAYTFMWDANAASQTTATATGLTAGTNYCVTVTDDNGCASSACVTIVVTGLEDIANTNAFKVYPNPTTGKVFVELGLDTPTDVQLTVFNAIGESVITKQLNGQATRIELNTGELPTGVYLMRFEMNKEISTQKLIIQRP